MEISRITQIDDPIYQLDSNLQSLYNKDILLPINSINIENIINKIKGKRVFEYFYLWFESISISSFVIDGEEIEGFYNQKYGYINPGSTACRFSVEIDCTNKSIYYSLSINYFKNEINTNKEKYALIFKTKKYDTFLKLLNEFHFSMGDLKCEDSPIAYLVYKYNQAFENRNLDCLNFLYKNAPIEVLKQRGDELLWFDFIQLSRYDWSNMLVDTGKALLNLLQGFSDIDTLFQKMEENPQEIMNVYNGISSYDDKRVFCAFVSALCNIYKVNFVEIYPEVKYDNKNGYALNCSYENGKIKIKNTQINNDYYGAVGQEMTTLLLNKSFDPLSMVHYTYIGQNGIIEVNFLPAIYLLYMCEHKKYENTLSAIRIGFDIIVLIASLHPIAGGAARGIRLALFAIDAIAAGVDIGIELSKTDRDYLLSVSEESEEAGWFLRNWDMIYAMVGMGVFSYQMVDAIIIKGPLLIRFLKINGKNLSLVDKITALIKVVDPYKVARGEVNMLKRVIIVPTLFNKIGITDSVAKNLTENLGITLARSRTTDDVEVFFEGVKIYSGEEKATKQWLETLHMKYTPDAKKWLRELEGIGEVNGLFRRIVYSGGKRGETLLTVQQKMEIVEYAKRYGVIEEDIVFIDGITDGNTRYGLIMGVRDRLYINTDIMPGTLKTANSRLSWKAALAHELEGHRAAAIKGKTFFDKDLSDTLNDLLEEIQASIRASILGQDLSNIERADLLADAIERFEKYKLLIKDSKYENYSFNQLKEKLWTLEN